MSMSKNSTDGKSVVYESNDVSIVEESKMEITDALVLVGFPTIGLVGSIVANHVIRQLHLRRIGYFSSKFFAPTSVVIDGVPNPPVRIYAGDHLCGPGKRCQQVVVITSEFTPPVEMIEPLADAIVSWNSQNNVSMTVTLEGFNSQSDPGAKPEIISVGSTLEARHMLKEFDVPQMSEGMVGGVSGVLLHKGSVEKMNIISLLAEAPSNYPAARSAARTIEVLDKMLPLIKLDPQPLYARATEIESAIKEALTKATPKGELGPAGGSMAYM